MATIIRSPPTVLHTDKAAMDKTVMQRQSPLLLRWSLQRRRHAAAPAADLKRTVEKAEAKVEKAVAVKAAKAKAI